MGWFTEPSGRLRLVWRLAILIAGYVVVQVLCGVLGAVAGLIYLAATTGNINGFAGWVTQPEVMLRMQLVVTLPQLAMLMGLVWLARTLLDKRPLQSLGMKRPRRGWPASIAGGVALGAAPILLSVGVLAALGALKITGVHTVWLTALLVPAFGVLAFNEEIVVRGYILQNFVDIDRPVAGALVSSLFFWLAHSLNPAAWSNALVGVNLFGAGIVLALAYLASGNIWFPTVVHFAWNLTQGVVFELPVSGLKTDGLIDVSVDAPIWLAGGAFGLEASVLITIAEILMALLLGWSLWRRAQPERNRSAIKP